MTWWWRHKKSQKVTVPTFADFCRLLAVRGWNWHTLGVFGVRALACVRAGGVFSTGALSREGTFWRFGSVALF